MGLRRSLVDLANTCLRRMGGEFVPVDELEHYRRIHRKYFPEWGATKTSGPLPPGAEEYLRPDNPRLAELTARYEAAKCPAFQHSIWRRQTTDRIPLQWFRVDSPFLFQWQEYNAECAYVITAYYLRAQDRLNLLGALKEDGAFGAHTACVDNELVVSRDLLDSINEILFLDEMLKISVRPDMTLLDIGAGYGRLPHRLACALPNLKQVLATDAIPVSTFLSEYYLRYRATGDRARVVPLDEIEDVIRSEDIGCAVNIHSFSECTLASIEWWIGLLSRRGVRHLMIAPNARTHGGTLLLSGEPGNSKPQDYMPVLNKHGYRRICMRPKYLAPSVQKQGVSPTHYHLFELADWGPA